MLSAADLIVLLEDAIDNIDYPGTDAAEWTHKAKQRARELYALAAPPPLPEAAAKNRFFTHAHLRLVFLLSQTAGGTSTRLERLWATKVARTGDLAWPFISSSGLRTRLSELKRWGVIEWSGDWGMTVSNRRSRVWRLAAIDDGSATQIPGYDPDVRPALAALRLEAGSDVVTIAALEAVASAAGIRA